jgi:hypothetical protein
VIYAKQAIDWRKGTEGRELENVSAIARGAKKYADEHEGTYPKDLAALLDGKYVSADELLSPFGGGGTEYILKNPPAGNAAPDVAGHSDYTYTGVDLRLGKEAVQPAVIVVYKTEPVMRVHFSAGFMDGSAKFLDLEGAEEALKENNKARGRMGLAPLTQPASVTKAMETATRP